MKGIFAVLLIVLSLSCVYSQIPAQFNQTLFVNQTATAYAFANSGLTLMTLTVSASNAVRLNASSGSNVVVYTQAFLPTISTSNSLNVSVFANNGLPVGYAAFGGSTISGALGAGLNISMSADIEGNAQANISVAPTVLAALGLTASLGSFSPLYFDANSQTYVDLPTSQWYANAASGINIYTNRSVFIVFSATNPAAITVSIANGAIAYANVVAGRAASLVVNDGTNTALTIYNITASAGRVSVRVAANAASEGSTLPSGNVLVSQVYTFDHSGGSGAVSSAVLSYDFTSKGLNGANAANVRWYKWNGSSWVQQGGSVNGNLAVYQTNGFSDWSAQTNPNATPTPSPSRSSSASCASSFLKYVF